MSTKNIIDELESFLPRQTKHKTVESRASHVISSAIYLLEMIEKNFSEKDYEDLSKKLLLAIKTKQPSKFVNKVRTLKESDGER